MEAPPGRIHLGRLRPRDQLGRLNLITPEKVKQGVAEVREGRTFCLSLPLDYPGGAVLNPRRTPPVLSATGTEERPRYNMPFSVDNPLHTDVVCDDRVLLTLQYSTQWDSLCHVGAHFDADGDGRAEPLFYNGHHANVDVVGPIDYRTGERTTEPIGARRLGVENMAAHGIQGRGVLADLHAHFGQARKMVSRDDLLRVMDQDQVVVEKGDMLLLHTGFSQAILDMKRNPDGEKLGSSYAVLDGRDDALLRWITDSGIASLIADNYGVEAVPSRPGGLAPPAQAQPLPPDRAAAPASRRRRLTRDADRDSVRRSAQPRSGSMRRPLLNRLVKFAMQMTSASSTIWSSLKCRLRSPTAASRRPAPAARVIRSA